MSSTISKDTIPEHIINIYKKNGNADYIGENITQIEHALQSAYLASQENPTDYEFILASLFHDIGHILNIEGQQFMDNLGVATHENIGADYLKLLGFPERIYILIKLHVKAKRYLVSTRDEYRNNLSEASYKTMKYQGGIMNSDEIKEFETYKYYKDAIRLRYIDDYAKKTKEEMVEIPDIDYYKNMIIRVLE